MRAKWRRRRRRAKKEMKKMKRNRIEISNSRLQVLGVAKALDLSELARLLGLAHGGREEESEKLRRRKRARTVTNVTTAASAFMAAARKSSQCFFEFTLYSLSFSQEL